MDTALIVLMLAACICGSYKNSVDFPPPFQGNMAQALENNKYSKKPALPYYLRDYGNIRTGTI